ncbi:MAG: linear amide C-N hydrolase [bacterium]
MKVRRFAVATVFLLLLVSAGYCCSSVFVDQPSTKLVGRTMDWVTGNGHVSVNARGISKAANYLQDGSKPVIWTSKYGSVTFDLEMQFNFLEKLVVFLKRINTDSGSSCGLNEKGLWGGSLWIHPPPAVVYPAKDGRPSINDWQLLGYLLDNCANVEEVLTEIKKIRVSGYKEAGFEVDLHWFVADASGDSAIIEFPDGKLEIHRRPVPLVMTNSFYEHGHDYLKSFQGFGGSEPVPSAVGEMTTENRLLFGAYFLNQKQKAGRLTMPNVFDLMSKVTQTNVRHAQTSQAVTQWTTVYDLTNREIFWTSRLNQNVRQLKLADFDFSNPPKKLIDINANL